MNEQQLVGFMMHFFAGAFFTAVGLFVGYRIGRIRERRAHIAQLYALMARNEGPATIAKVEPPRKDTWAENGTVF